MSERNIKIIVAYEGTNYKGWQRQKDAVTVQGTIEAALADIIGRWVRVHGASRTDAGVHAESQVAHFYVDSPIPDEAFAWLLSGRLPGDIVVRSARTVPRDFDESTDAACKTYLYRFYTGRVREVQFFRRRWRTGTDLDPAAMHQAAQYIVGTHDFKGFASAKDMRETTVRTVMSARAWRVADDEIDFEITADRYLYQMVRTLAGTLAEIGRGRWQPEKMAQILASRDRTTAGPTAPPNGLCLMHIEYHKNLAIPLDIGG